MSRYEADQWNWWSKFFNKKRNENSLSAKWDNRHNEILLRRLKNNGLKNLKLTMPTSYSWQVLSFMDQYFYPAIEAIGEELCSLEALWISTDGFDYKPYPLLHVLSRNNSLEFLIIHGTDQYNKNVTSVLEAALSNPRNTINSIHIDSNDSDQLSCWTSEIIERMKLQLKRLSINTLAADISLQSLSDILDGNQTLTMLSTTTTIGVDDSHAIDNAGDMERFVNSLKKNTTLQSLRFQIHYIGGISNDENNVEGCGHIFAKAFDENCTLKHLEMCSTMSGALAFTQSLPPEHKITTLKFVIKWLYFKSKSSLDDDETIPVRIVDILSKTPLEYLSIHGMRSVIKKALIITQIVDILKQNDHKLAKVEIDYFPRYGRVATTRSTLLLRLGIEKYTWAKQFLKNEDPTPSLTIHAWAKANKVDDKSSLKHNVSPSSSQLSSTQASLIPAPPDMLFYLIREKPNNLIQLLSTHAAIDIETKKKIK